MTVLRMPPKPVSTGKSWKRVEYNSTSKILAAAILLSLLINNVDSAAIRRVKRSSEISSKFIAYQFLHVY